MSEIRTGFCPNCSNRLEFTEGEAFVICPCCDNSVDVASMLGNKNGSAEGGMGMGDVAAAMGAAFTGFDNPESGIVFMENYFDTMDWTEYKESPLITMGAFTEVLNNNKMKNGAIGATWYLEFMGLCVPLTKKFEGLKEKLAEIGKSYDPEDSSAAFGPFDIYRKIAKVLDARKDELLKRLQTAITYAEKFSLDKEKLATMKTEMVNVSDLYDGLKLYEDIHEVPEYKAAVDANNDKKGAELAAKGIDAQVEYEGAVNQYNSSNPDKGIALERFEKIRGYADSVEYIESINRCVDFNKLRSYFGKYYVFNKEEAKEGTFNAKKGCLGKKKEAGSTGETEDVLAAELCEVVHGVPTTKGLVGGVEEILATYNNKIYYVKKNKGIYAYDIYRNYDAEIDQGKDVDYYRNGSIQFATARNGRDLIIQRNIKPEDGKKGCLGGKKKKQAKPDEIRLNNYCLLHIDMLTSQSQIIIPEMVDVIGRFGNQIFYSHAHREQRPIEGKKGCLGKKTELVPVTQMKVCDLTTGENKDVLSESCDLCEVVGNKVIYTYYKNNKYNKDLHVYDLKTGADVIIEENIFNYNRIIKDNIYYTVGNGTYYSLMRNSFDGANRKEVMKNVERIITDMAGWLYVIKGAGRNRAIYKVHSDDIEKRVLLCPQFSEIEEITATHVYYNDTSNCLRVVRTDGKENTEIGKNISSIYYFGGDKAPSRIIVDEDCLYYCREERVADAKAVSLLNLGNLSGDTSSPQYNLSLYKVDKDGHNMKKLVFNVDRVVNYDKKSLYYMKKETLEYEVTVPTKKGKEEKHKQFFDVERYFRFDKATEKSELVLTIGLPDANTKIKSGCFLKKAKDGEITFEEVPAKPEYKPRGLTAMGAVAREQEQQAQKAAEAGTAEQKGCLGALGIKTPKAASNNNNANNSTAGCGCLKGNKQQDNAKKGCLGK